jgi:hypothetical protein
MQFEQRQSGYLRAACCWQYLNFVFSMPDAGDDPTPKPLPDHETSNHSIVSGFKPG